MRQRLSADYSREQDQPDCIAHISPTPPPEHDDKPGDRVEGLQVKEHGGWARSESGQEEDVNAPNQQPATERLPVHDHSTTTPPQPHMAQAKAGPAMGALGKDIVPDSVVDGHNSKWRQRLRNPWACSPYTLVTTLAAFAVMFLMAQSFLTRQLDVKGCGMSYMRPMYSRYNDFDTEHTRFASKYSLFLYREGGLDEDTRVCICLSHEKSWY
jgi:glycosylphosphatidylinositol deacylase